MLSALAAVIATVVLSLQAQMNAGATAVSTLLLAPAAAIASWVIFSSLILRSPSRDSIWSMKSCFWLSTSLIAFLKQILRNYMSCFRRRISK